MNDHALRRIFLVAGIFQGTNRGFFNSELLTGWPANNFSVEQIKYDRQVEPAIPFSDVGDLWSPDFIESSNGEILRHRSTNTVLYARNRYATRPVTAAQLEPAQRKSSIVTGSMVAGQAVPRDQPPGVIPLPWCEDVLFYY